MQKKTVMIFKQWKATKPNNILMEIIQHIFTPGGKFKNKKKNYRKTYDIYSVSPIINLWIYICHKFTEK